MRTYRLIILVVATTFLSGCKATQTTQAVTQTTYSEDLSILRPDFGKNQETVIQRSEPTVPLDGHIKMELDSISNMISRENAKPRIEQGFTIQLYNGFSRNEATKILKKIRLKYPEIKARMTYYQPTFRVKAGQFVDRITAYETYERVRRTFLDALLIPEKIKINYD